MENLHAVPHFNKKYLVLWTTPKTLEPPWRNRLKQQRIRSGLHSRIVEFSRVKYFYTFVSSLNYVPSIGANTDKRRWSCHEGLDRTFDLCCQRTIRSESTRDKAGSLPPASRDYFMLFVIFFFFFLRQLNSKNNGPVLLSKTIFWHWYCFPSSAAMDCKDWKWIET